MTSHWPGATGNYHLHIYSSTRRLKKNEQKRKGVLFTTYRKRDREVEEETLTPTPSSSFFFPALVPYLMSFSQWNELRLYPLPKNKRNKRDGRPPLMIGLAGFAICDSGRKIQVGYRFTVGKIYCAFF